MRSDIFVCSLVQMLTPISDHASSRIVPMIDLRELYVCIKDPEKVWKKLDHLHCHVKTEKVLGASFAWQSATRTLV